ncbi:MAG: hypothetical protein WKF73_04595 [Nocardioidaceae bacterium]
MHASGVLLAPVVVVGAPVSSSLSAVVSLVPDSSSVAPVSSSLSAVVCVGRVRLVVGAGSGSVTLTVVLLTTVV